MLEEIRCQGEGAESIGFIESLTCRTVDSSKRQGKRGVDLRNEVNSRNLNS